VFPPIHDAHDDRACVCRHLDEIEAGLSRYLLRLIKGDDAYLRSFGINKTNRTDPDLIVDADVLFDAKNLLGKGSSI
jgi:hypothetical protein